MDHSWRPRLPIQGNNICPTCSISHFPFCPPHPQFNENPRSQLHNDYFLHRPRFEPYIDHRGPTTSLHHRPFAGDLGQGFADRRCWQGNPSNYDISDDFGSHYYRDDFASPHSYGNGSVGFKRMRVDDRGLSNLFVGGENNVDSSTFSSESERILKLIRDHGNAPGGPPQGGARLLPEANGYGHQKFEELRDVRDDIMSKLTSKYDISDFRNPDVDYFDSKGAPFQVENGLNVHIYGEDHGVVLRKTHMHSDRSDEHHRLQYNKYDIQPAEHFINKEQYRQSQDEAFPYYKGEIPYDSIPKRSEMQQRSPMAQNGYYPITETPLDNYHKFQGLPLSDTVSIKESHYSPPSTNQLAPPYAMQHSNRDFHSPSLPGDTMQSVGVNVPSQDGIQGSVGYQNPQVPYGWPKLNEDVHHQSIPFGRNLGVREASHLHNPQPPLPASPPPPLPIDPPKNYYPDSLASSKTPSSLFPIAVSSSADVPSSYTPAPVPEARPQTYYANKPKLHSSTGFSAEEFQERQTTLKKYLGEGQPFSLTQKSIEKLNIVDACHIFKQPHRTTRPDHLVIILRGLPGSGKSYMAKMLRDLEVENGGEAPRIHSMDEYFMTEVDKVEESEGSKSSGSARGKKTVMKKVMEYCYEPEMEEAYRSSMLKAFKKSLDEGVFSFIIVDDRNLRVADFAQFWATAKRSGYEVYLLEAAYKDPAGCAARNVHGFNQDDIQKMARQWEEAPSLYLKLDIKSLLHGDGLEESGIQEVDMDMEDEDPADGLQGSEVRNPENAVASPVDNFKPHGSLKDDRRWYPLESDLTEVKELKRSKWSNDLEEDDPLVAEGRKGNSGALTGLIQAYSKGGKSVHWGDQAEKNIGFSIGAVKRTNVMSLVIGPGSGYNLKSNPLSEEDSLSSASNAQAKRHIKFQERMRAERESFKAVFDKRRQRIGGFNAEEE